MRLNGYFKSCAVKTYQKKDGTEGKSIEAMFAVEGETDVIKVTTWRDRQWCEERGIKTGAAGTLRAHFGTNDRGYYEQVIWGFEPLEQKQAEEAEKAALQANQEMIAEAEEKAKQAVAAAQAAGESTDLPF